MQVEEYTMIFLHLGFIFSAAGKLKEKAFYKIQVEEYTWIFLYPDFIFLASGKLKR